MSMQTKTTGIDDLTIRYAISQKDHQETLLLLQPMPESIYCYTPMWDQLAANFNLLAIDMPGFGGSEARSGLYSVDAMSHFIPEAIEHFELGPVHILGPDIGAPIALFAAARYPASIRSLIVGGGASVYPLEVDNVLRDVINAPDLEGFKKIPVKDIIDSSLSEFKNYALPAEIRADYIACYEGGRLFDAMQILRAYTTDIPQLDKLIDKIRTPVQIIWGDKDPIALVKTAYILHDRLPKNNMHIIGGGGHYLWEEHAAEYSAVIIDWITRGYKKQ